ncbi:hypothetical protein WJX81_001909 [Elliptochloris bilobata]|uniref:Mediator of RNA polymerase II transcription subunit 6 n=1 Tax=Elliptochloris bilobata TaxID=381761 RepID=A0AAW1S9B3_9CHLO
MSAAARSEEEDLSGVCWRDDQWLQFFPLNRLSALDYFALSPFYDRTCNNEQAKLQGLDPTKVATLPPGIEYELQEVQEPHLFVVCRQLRTTPKAATRQQFFYILDGSVYQAPSLHAAMASRVSRCLYNVRQAFQTMQADLDPLLKVAAKQESAAGTSAAAAAEAPAPAVQKRLTNAEKERWRLVDRMLAHILAKYPLPQGAAGLAAPASGGAVAPDAADPLIASIGDAAAAGAAPSTANGAATPQAVFQA